MTTVNGHYPPNDPEKTDGIAFLCDSAGVVRHYLIDTPGVSRRLKTGRPFMLAFDTDSAMKAMQFFKETKSAGKAYNWELCVVLDSEECRVFHFFGRVTGDGILIIGAESLTEIASACFELVKNEDLRHAAVELMTDSELTNMLSRNDSHQTYFEELTRLYHDLETAQRAVAKKNNQLEKANQQLEEQKEELIALNESLNQTISELERTRNTLVQNEKMASLGRMVAGFAHEINTPIGVAVTASSALNDTQEAIMHMLASEEADEEELVEHLETIRDASRLLLTNLQRAADMVVSFKRTSVDQAHETQRLFGLPEVIHDIVLSLNNRFKHTRIEIRTDCPEHLNIYGYPGVIGQILTNLLMNSYVYGFNEGKTAGAIDIRAAQTNGRITIEYADNGAGMDEETRKRLFEPFFTSLRGKGGTGLGMYICYNLVTARLNGSIECESQPGEGVLFRIHFPANPALQENHDEVDTQE